MERLVNLDSNYSLKHNRVPVLCHHIKYRLAPMKGEEYHSKHCKPLPQLQRQDHHLNQHSHVSTPEKCRFKYPHRADCKYPDNILYSRLKLLSSRNNNRLRLRYIFITGSRPALKQDQKILQHPRAKVNTNRHIHKLLHPIFDPNIPTLRKREK